MKKLSVRLPEKASDFSNDEKNLLAISFTLPKAQLVPGPTPVPSVELAEDEMWGADIYVGRRAQCRNP